LLPALGWLVMLFLAAASVWRIGRGPGTLDRMVGLDGVTVAVVGAVVISSLQERTTDFVELVIVVTALGFFTTVAFYYYLAQPKPDSHEDFNREKEGRE
jgi:multisubunit Na+/H+ antiporter MnhF subunit